MDLRHRCWDPELCDLFGVPIEALPEIRPTAGDFGTARLGGRRVPVTAGIVDQQGALFGHGCLEEGQTKVTFGTGAFALANSGAAPPPRHRYDPRPLDQGLLARFATAVERARGWRYTKSR